LKPADISNDVRQFIFDYIDSVEQLEVLFLLKSSPEKWWTAADISNQLRSTPTSIDSRISRTKLMQFLDSHPNTPQCYRYHQTAQSDEIIDKVLQEYKLRRQAILELIFSPVKRSRSFADAFIINQPNEKKKEDENG
jgi:hypothetical protein